MKQTYIGCKMIDAEPMTLGAYNELRGWSIPEDEDPSREGYHVTYPDGYQSWSPKDVFESAYLPAGRDGVTYEILQDSVASYYAVSKNRDFVSVTLVCANGFVISHSLPILTGESEDERIEQAKFAVAFKLSAQLDFLIMAARNGWNNHQPPIECGFVEE